MFSFGKFMTGALISAALAVGGVWFVVDMSLRGLEVAIETTNKRIDDVRTELSTRLDEKFDNLELKLRLEFESTRKSIEKASLEPALDQNVPGPNQQKIIFAGGKAAFVWEQQKGTVDDLLDENLFSKWKELNREKLKSAKDSNFQIFGVVPTNFIYDNIDVSHKFIQEAINIAEIDINDDVLSQAMADGCLEKNHVDANFMTFRPTDKMIVGSNGMVCPLFVAPK